MPSIVLYLLKCSISLALIWLFYQLLLRRLTFYTMNRWYLLGYAILSFLLPLVHIVLPAGESIPGKVRVISYIPAITELPAIQAAPVFTGWDLLLGIVTLVALVLMGRLLMRWLSLRRIRKESTLMRHAEMAIYQVDKPIIPFSFGNAIYINARLHTEREWLEIIRHEYVHVRQKHTVDIILAELLCIVSWFNPFSWLIRHSIRQNLEFIADQQVLASGLDRKSYQYHLLKVIGEPSFRLANNFNFSSLKKRIIMMNRSKSTRLHLLKFLFIVPMLGVLLVAFRDKVNVNSSLPIDVVPAFTKNDTTPGEPKKAVSLNPGANPLIFIDEEESLKDLHTVNPNSIQSINVLKDSDAAAFGAAGANGVVLIYTKNYVKKGEVRLKNGKRVKVETSDLTDAEKNKLNLALKDTGSGWGELQIRNGQIIKSGNRDTGKIDVVIKDRNSAEQLRKCLYVVDGVEASYEMIKKLDQNTIASIDVLKDGPAVARYGEKGRNGVVLIKTQSPGSKGPVSIVIRDKKDTVTLTADTIHYKFPEQEKTPNK